MKSIKVNRYIFTTFLAISIGSLQAQQSKVTLKKGDEAFHALNFPKAIGYYERYLQFFKKDKGEQPEARAYAQLARAHWNIRDYVNSGRWLDSLPREILLSDNELLRKRAEIFAIHGRYDSARALLSTLSSFAKRAEGFRNVGQFQKDSSDWHLGYALVNTPDFNEFSPVILNGRVMWSTNEPAFKSQHTVAAWDGKSMIRQAWVEDGLELELGGVPAPRVAQNQQTAKVKRLANTYTLAENSLRSQGSIAKGSRSTILNPNDLLREFIGLNRLDFNVGHATACIASGRVYFSANEEGRVHDDAPRTLKVVEADVRGGMVVATRFLDLALEDSIAMHPAIHPGGELLVYSAMRRGRTDYDLYVSRRDSTGKWSAPLALEALNTPGNEVFSTFDGSGTLFFSSDGRPGLGGLDIYKATMSEAGIPGTVGHISYPLNSSYDDFGWTEIPGSNGRGYLTSNRHGSDDIFGFRKQFYDTRITGAVVDINTGLRQSGVKVTVFRIEADGVTRHRIGEFVTDDKGNYSVEGQPDKYYEVRLSNTGDLKDDRMKDPQVHKVYSEKDKSWVSAPPLFVGRYQNDWADANRIPAKVGGGPIPGMDTLFVFESGSLRPAGDMSAAGQKPDGFTGIREFIVNFDFDSANIDLQAEATIRDLLGYLRTYPHARLMLMGHTDVEGTNEYNVGLSERRVRRVKGRLAELGYPATRIATSYYGELQPRIQTRNKAEARTNRRVEIFILR
jgi:outer membrane protein OmpA-like peptidoglycan-associated protein/tetratricopeptide (TPR) repeat protein